MKFGQRRSIRSAAQAGKTRVIIQMRQWFKRLFLVFKETFVRFGEDKVPYQAAALAYYMIFSLAPTLIIAITLVSLFVDQNHAQAQVISEAEQIMGQEAGELVSQMLTNSPNPTDSEDENSTGNLIGALISVGALLFGASNVFAQLQDALNTIWGIEQKPRNGILNMLRKRVFAFFMLLIIGFMLLVSLIVNTVLNVFSDWIQVRIPESFIFVDIGNELIFFLLLVLLFGLLYKILPDVKIRWHDIWAGTILTAVLFNLGRWLISLYVGSSALIGLFGTASAIIVVLVWIYYSAQIFLFGAEFAQVYARHRGRPIQARE
jgi:membrane protein